MSADADRLIAKIQKLPPHRIAEIEDFVDFVGQQEAERALAGAAAAASARAFGKIWDNPEDDAHDGV